MDKEILVAILMSAINYIVVSTISSSSAQKTQDYFKAQLDQLGSSMTELTRANLVNVLNEIKEQGESTRELTKEETERVIEKHDN